MSDSNKTPLLHIYPQNAHHQEVYIQGNIEGLCHLVNAICSALVKRSVESKDVFVSDGEGYKVVVVLKDGDLKEWEKVAVPYTADYAKEHREDAVWPWMVVK